jgi:hypothetical protein
MINGKGTGGTKIGTETSNKKLLCEKIKGDSQIKPIIPVY